MTEAEVRTEVIEAESKTRSSAGGDALCLSVSAATAAAALLRFVACEVHYFISRRVSGRLRSQGRAELLYGLALDTTDPSRRGTHTLKLKACSPFPSPSDDLTSPPLHPMPLPHVGSFSSFQALDIPTETYNSRILLWRRLLPLLVGN